MVEKRRRKQFVCDHRMEASLERVAERHGRTVSDVIRAAVADFARRPKREQHALLAKYRGDVRGWVPR